jgi:hypothetical protein
MFTFAAAACTWCASGIWSRQMLEGRLSSSVLTQKHNQETPQGPAASTLNTVPDTSVHVTVKRFSRLVMASVAAVLILESGPDNTTSSRYFKNEIFTVEFHRIYLAPEPECLRTSP